jgi:predicted ATPase
VVSSANFRAFKSLTDTFLPVEPCTILIGPNGSGKSNVVDGLQFLQRIARGMRLEEALDGVRSVIPGLRGGAAGAPPDGDSWFAVGCTVNDGEVNYTYEIEVEVSPTLRVREERLTRVDSLSVESLPVLGPEGRTTEAGPALEPLRRLVVLDPQPSQMREWVVPSYTRLSPSGDNLSAIVARVLGDREQRRLLLHWLGHLIDQPIAEVGVLRAPTDEVRLYLTESFGERRIQSDARRLSDGTLRYLAILVALMTEPRDTTLVIDDIDLGLDRGRARLLLEALRHFSHQHGIHVIATANDAGLVDGLEGAALVRCRREAETGRTRLVPWGEV